MTRVRAEAGKSIKSAMEQMKNSVIAMHLLIVMCKGDDRMTDWYGITERIKKFNDILNEVGGSL